MAVVAFKLIDYRGLKNKKQKFHPLYRANERDNFF